MPGPRLLMLGVTADLAFAAGCLLLSLRRHSPELAADILVFTDDRLPGHDAALLQRLGAGLRSFQKPQCALNETARRTFSAMCLARFEAFLHLDHYDSVVWLDVDTAIQDDVTSLFDWGPFSLALEDPHFTDAGTSRAGINVLKPVPGLDPQASNFNSGVMVLNASLPEPRALHALCLDWLQAHGPWLNYPDQAALNMLAQHLSVTHPEAVRILPHDRFNAHPRNPASLQAAVVHAFGAYKLWDDGLTRCAFPEWQRDYLRWLELGGSPWAGPVDNQEFLGGPPFFMLRRLFELSASAQDLLEKQQQELDRERALRQRLETIMQRASARPSGGA